MEYIVTTLSDPDPASFPMPGTLRYAIEQAKYDRDEEIVIVFAEELEGWDDSCELYMELDRSMTISNKSSQNINLYGSYVHICDNAKLTVGEGIKITGSWNVDYGGTLCLNDTTVDGEISLLYAEAKLEGRGNVFTKDAMISIWASASTGDTVAKVISELTDPVFADDQIRIGISQCWGDAVLNDIPGVSYYLRGCYVSRSLTVEEGVEISGSLYVLDGGTLRLDHAVIDGSIYLTPGATLEGEGNVFTSSTPIYLVNLSGSSADAWEHAISGLTDTFFTKGKINIGIGSLAGDTVLNAIPGAGYYMSQGVCADQTLTVEEGVEISGWLYVLDGGTLRLDHAVVNGTISMYPDAILEGEGVVFNKGARIILNDLKGTTADRLAGLTNSISESGKIEVWIDELAGDAVLSAIPGVTYNLSWLSGGVNYGDTLTVEKGVTISDYLTVGNGSTLWLNGAVVDSTINLEQGAILKGDGNTFTDKAGIRINLGGGIDTTEDALSGLTNSVFQTGQIRVSIGSISDNAVISAIPGVVYHAGNDVYSEQTLTVESEVVLSGRIDVHNEGTLRLNGAVVKGGILLYTGAILEGEGNVFTNGANIQFSYLSGATADILAGLTNTVFDGVQMKISGLSGDAVLSAIPGVCYNVQTYVSGGRTLSVEEGVEISGYITIYRTGTLLLDGAVIDGRINLYPGAKLEGAGNIFTDRAIINLFEVSGSVVDAWTTATAGLTDSVYQTDQIRIGIGSLSGDTVLSAFPGASYILSSCSVYDGKTLEVEEGVAVCGSASIGSGSSFVMENAYLPADDSEGLILTIDKGCGRVKISGCDLSQTSLQLTGSGDGVIDLSGNYWGTTDREEILSRIGGYDVRNVILDDILTVEPNTDFTLLGTDLRRNVISSTTTEFAVRFSHNIDASSVEEECIRLVDSNGRELDFTVEVQGKKLIFHIDPINEEVKIYLYLGNGIKDLTGQTYVSSTNAPYDLRIKCDLAPPRVDHVTPGGDFAGTFSSFTVYFTEDVDPSDLQRNVWIENPDGDKVAVDSFDFMSDSTVRFTVAPQTAHGAYTIHVGADVCDSAGNRLDQNGNGVGGEEGDAFSAVFNLTEIELSVSDVTVADRMISGTVETVDWMGKNDTVYALSGSWTDGVYLSTDTKWDIYDIKLGTYTHTGGLTAGGTYTGSLSFAVPGVSPGAYYLLVRSDVYGQEMADKDPAEYARNLEAVPVYVGMTELDTGTAANGSLDKEDARDYYVLKDAGSKIVNLALGGLASGEKAEVYIAYGKVPTREMFDKSYQLEAAGLDVILEGNGSQDDLYILICKRASSAALDYTLMADFRPVAITGVTPSVYNKGGAPEFDIYGANFATDTQVELVDGEGRAYIPESVTWVSGERLKVTYAEGALPAGKLDVRVSSNGDVCCSAGAIEMVESAGAHLLFDMKLPSSLGYHMISTISVSFENVGWETMNAPLVFVTAVQNGGQNAILTMDPSKVNKGFWTSVYPEGFSTGVSFLAANTGAGTLSPTGSFWEHYDNPTGGTPTVDADFDTDGLQRKWTTPLQNTVDIYYIGWQEPWDLTNPPIDVNVTYITADNTETIDWLQILDATSYSGCSRGILEQALPETFGVTWGDYVKHLNRTLAYLDGLGVDTSTLGSDDLLQFNLRSLLGKTAPVSVLASSNDIGVATAGIGLNVGRSFANDLESRVQDGAFGYGWSFNWDIRLERDEDGTVVISQNGTQYVYQPDYRGSYVAVNGSGSLSMNRDGGFVLTGTSGDKIVFSSGGQVLSMTDVYSNSLHFDYDGSGDLQKITHSDGQSISFEWADGHIVRITDHLGDSVGYEYADGHLVSVTDQLGYTIRYEYSSEWEHALQAVVAADGTRKEFTYNERGLLESQSATSMDGGISGYGKVTLGYGEYGDVTMTDVYGNSSTYYYDQNGRIRRSVDMDGNSIYYGYDTQGNNTWVKDQAGNVTRFVYDGKGRVISTTDALGNTTSYTYTASGALESITDAKGDTIRYVYDSSGQTSAIEYADGSWEGFAYDSSGKMISTTSRSGELTSFSYDTNGHLLDTTFADGTCSTRTYDTRGLLLSVSGTEGDTVSYTYNDHYNVTRVDYGNGQSITYEYGEYDRLLSMTDECGHKTCYAYDVLGRLAQVMAADGSLIVAYEYDLGGRITKQTNGNDTYTEYTYTKYGSVETLTNHAADGSVQTSYRYGYDAVGLNTSVESYEGVWTYEYDAIGQLTHAVFTPASGSSISVQDLAYEYDAVGNRTRSVVNGVETLYTNNELNQTTSAGDASMEYDADGNLIRKTDSTGVTTYEYNAIGKLSRMVTSTGSVHEYSYNALGQRVAVTVDGVTTRFVYDPAGNLLNDYDAEGTLQNSYRYGNCLVGYEDAMNLDYYYQGDVQGSITGVTDASGNLVGLLSYNPFGEVLSSTCTSDPNTLLGWLGQWGVQTDGSGQVYMSARYYDQSTGTFTQADPIGLAGGLNLYAYCGNNPVSFIDASGLSYTWGGVFNEMFNNALDVDMLLSSEKVLKNFDSLSKSAIQYLVGQNMALIKIIKKGINGEYSGDDGKLEAANDYIGLLTKISVLIPGIKGDLIGSLSTNLGDMAENLFIAGLCKYSPAVAYVTHVMMPLYKKLGDDLADKLIGTPIDRAMGSVANWIIGKKYEKSFQEALRRVREEYGNLPAATGSRLPANSSDPNDLIGPTGYGDANFISTQGAMSFMLEFENEAEATSPTHWIRLKNEFDEAFDLDSFTLDAFCLGGNYVNVADGLDSFNQLVEMEFEGKKVQVQVSINLDYEERTLSAEFMAVDPETGFMIQDPEVGMLFPEDGTSRGMGYVTYDISLRPDLTTGTTVNNAADIYFDFNEVIPTPEIIYTIDGDGPASRMLAAEDMMDGGKMQISWEGADAEGGSGLMSYCVFVSKDGGDFELLGIFDADTTSVTCQGEDKARYDFYVLAMDNVGNLETAKETAETGVFIDSSKWLTTATKGKKVTFGWPAVEGAYSYVVTVTRADGTGKPTVKKVTKPTLVATLADNFYDWTVTAVTKKGEVLEEMSGRSFRVDSKAPTKVAKLAAAQKEGAEGATAVLTWAAAADVSPVKYVVEYSVKSNFAKGTVTTLETAGLAAALPVEPGKYVYYRVRAVDSFGNMSAWATGKYGEPSIPPTGQKIDSVTGRKVAVSWDAAEGAKSYVVTLKNVLTGKVALTKTVKTTNVLLTVPDGEYTWTVQAVSAAGIRSLDVPDGSLLLDLTAPKAVTKLTSARTGEGGMTLTWTAPKDATCLRYVVEYSENADFSASTTMEVGGTSATISAAAGAQLYCRVKALDRADNESPWTALGVLTATTKGKVVTLGWAAVAGAASYTVTFTGEDGKTVVKKVKTNALTATLADNVYGWTVQALDKNGQALSEVTGKGFKVDSIAPVKVAGLTAARKAGAVGGTAVLTWDASADASDVTYIIEYSTKSNFAKGTVTTLETADLTAELPVEPGKYVYYRVTAVDSFGNKSKAVGGKYGEPAIAPAELVCTVDNKTVTLGWAAVEGAKSYIVTFTNVETGKVTVKTAKTNSLKTAMAVGGYTWTVQTVSAAGIKSDGAEGAGPLYIGMAPPPVVDPDYGTLTTAMPAGEALAWLPAASDPLETGAPAAVETVGTGVQTPTGGIDQELALSAGVACTPGTVTGLADTGCVYALEPETEATRRQAMLASPLH